MNNEQRKLVEKLNNYFEAFICPKTEKDATRIINILNKLDKELSDCVITMKGDLNK